MAPAGPNYASCEEGAAAEGTIPALERPARRERPVGARAAATVLVALATVAVLAVAARSAATPAAAGAALASQQDGDAADGADAGEMFRWPWQSKKTSEKKHSSTCSACDNMKDSKCLILLDAAVDALSDTDRIAFEKDLVDTQSTVQGCPSWTCLQELDEMVAELSDKERLSLYTDACSSGDLEVSTATGDALWQWKSWPFWGKAKKTEKKHSSECSACDNKKDSKCLVLLDAAVDALTDTERISFEHAVVDVDRTVTGCPSWTCLEQLDELAAALSDADRLTTYTDACAQGLLTVDEAGLSAKETKSVTTVDSSEQHIAQEASLLGGGADSTATVGR